MDLDWNQLFGIIETAMVGPIAHRENHIVVTSGFLRLFITAIQRSLIKAAHDGRLQPHARDFHDGVNVQRINDVANLDAKAIWAEILQIVCLLEENLRASGDLNGYSARLEELRNSDAKRTQFAKKCIRHWKNAASNVASTKALRFICYKTLELANFPIDFGFNDPGVYADFMDKRMTLLPEAVIIENLTPLRRTYNIQICMSMNNTIDMDPNDAFFAFP